MNDIYINVKQYDGVDGGFDVIYKNIIQTTTPIDTTSFKMTVDTTQTGSAADTFIFKPYSTSNFVIQWGDGSSDLITSPIQAELTHIYSSGGTYQISIDSGGLLNGFNYSGTGDIAKIISVDQWGDNVWTYMYNMFYNANNLVSVANDEPNLTNINNMYQMFRGATSFNQDISSWDVSNVTNMGYMFYLNTAFNNGGVALNWGSSTSAVTSMYQMFFGATSFNQDISSWDVSSVTSMLQMLYQNTAFNNGGVALSWGSSTSAVTSMYQMFLGATSFNQDISSWDVSSVTNMSAMFYSTPFNQSIGSWNVSGVTTMSNMFYQNTAFNQDISSWDVSNVANMYQMFGGATSFNQDISSWDVSSVTSMYVMFFGATAFNNGGVALNWGSSTSAVTSMYQMFRGATSFNQDISSWDVSSVMSVYQMFFGATAFNNGGVALSWGSSTSAVTNMYQMFGVATSFNQDISSWDVSSVTNMSAMFYSTPFNQSIGSWNVSGVTTMSNMFGGGAGLSTSNYNDLLTGWTGWDGTGATNTLQSSVSLTAGSSKYSIGSESEEARDYLITGLTWTITDGGGI